MCETKVFILHLKFETLVWHSVLFIRLTEWKFFYAEKTPYLWVFSYKRSSLWNCKHELIFTAQSLTRRSLFQAYSFPLFSVSFNINRKKEKDSAIECSAKKNYENYKLQRFGVGSKEASNTVIRTYFDEKFVHDNSQKIPKIFCCQCWIVLLLPRMLPCVLCVGFVLKLTKHAHITFGLMFSSVWNQIGIVNRIVNGTKEVWFQAFSKLRNVPTNVIRGLTYHYNRIREIVSKADKAHKTKK